jgi:hypothetical protein
LRKKNSISGQENSRVSSCFQDVPLLDWGMSRRQVLGAGSAFIATAAFGGGNSQRSNCATIEISRIAAARSAQRGIFERSRHRS